MYSKNINFICAVPSFILHKVIYTYLKFLRFLIFVRVTCSLGKTFKLNQLSEGHQEIWEQVRKFLSCLCILNAQQIQVFFHWLLTCFYSLVILGEFVAKFLKLHVSSSPVDQGVSFPFLKGAHRSGDGTTRRNLSLYLVLIILSIYLTREEPDYLLDVDQPITKG